MPVDTSTTTAHDRAHPHLASSIDPDHKRDDMCYVQPVSTCAIPFTYQETSNMVRYADVLAGCQQSLWLAGVIRHG